MAIDFVQTEFTNTSGRVIVFGMRRMRVVELIASLLHVGNSQINEAMMESGIFQHLLVCHTLDPRASVRFFSLLRA